MKRVVVSAPGKVHLLGEHAVVYGKPAILAAIDLRLTVTITERERPAGGLNAISVESDEPTRHAEASLALLFEKLGVANPAPSHIRIRSDIPAGFHLGSSAALAVALSGAVMYFYKGLWNPIKINELAYEIEKKQHVTPSGGDNTAVTVGGLVWFRKELEFLKSIWQLPFTLHPALEHFFLINTGKPEESTGDMVKSVRTFYEKKPARMETLLTENERQVRRVTEALKAGNEDMLIDAIRRGERTLEGMGVVSGRAVPFIRAVEAEGGAVKILGGGGKKKAVGFLLCYHRDPVRIRTLASGYGWGLEHVLLGQDGIRLEEKS